jgi:hypothetical protein
MENPPLWSRNVIRGATAPSRRRGQKIEMPADVQLNGCLLDFFILNLLAVQKVLLFTCPNLGEAYGVTARKAGTQAAFCTGVIIQKQP